MGDRMYKEFLESQLQWSKNQISVLDEMESKLQEMKKIAECAAGNDLSCIEKMKLSSHLEELKNEFSFLEAKRSPLQA